MQNLYSATRYLAAKKTVDDRALNQHVVSALRSQLALREGATSAIEVGAGLGTMITRLVDWGLVSRAEYTLLDVDREALDASRAWLTSWGAAQGRAVEPIGDRLHIRGGRPHVDVTVHPLCEELGRHLALRSSSPEADLLIANAFLDLVDLPATLPGLFDLLRPGGLYWFSINFDGETIFEPGHPLDRPVLEAYHRSMDERVRYGRPAGDSRTGRRLFGQLRALGASILASGSSDWIVHAHGERYPADEAYFVDHILDTIEQALRAQPAVDRAGLREWLSARRLQLARGELVYIAHQLDFVGVAPDRGDQTRATATIRT